MRKSNNPRKVLKIGTRSRNREERLGFAKIKDFAYCVVMTIEAIRRVVVPVLKAHGILRAGLFGSAAAGKLRQDSDIDILIDTGGKFGLFKFLLIKEELEEGLGRKVDMVEYQALKPLLRQGILAQEVSLI